MWGIGLLNIFMCQFPFDLDAHVDTKVLAVLAGYDYVLLNSQFSYQVCLPGILPPYCLNQIPHIQRGGIVWMPVHTCMHELRHTPRLIILIYCSSLTLYSVPPPPPGRGSDETAGHSCHSCIAVVQPFHRTRPRAHARSLHAVPLL